MQVHRIPNSGWPGRPRNVGAKAASGEFLFFADHDDYLFPEALERMYAFAVENDLDVVHPKEVVKGWSRPGFRPRSSNWSGFWPETAWMPSGSSPDYATDCHRERTRRNCGRWSEACTNLISRRRGACWHGFPARRTTRRLLKQNWRRDETPDGDDRR
jgi:glycosyltransferase involved in cell wall biosynthesis